MFSTDISLVRQNGVLSDNGLRLYHTAQSFNDPDRKTLLKTFWEKEKMVVTSIFSFSQNVF